MNAKPVLYGPKAEGRYADDCALLKEFKTSDVARIGIDSPFGWPVAFVNALSNHRNRPGLYDWPRNDPEVYAGPEEKSEEEYRDLKYRATELVVWKRVKKVVQKKRTPLKPISVAVNSLGSVAIRNASLLSRAGAKGLSVDRSGSAGHFVEVYPAAAFAQWKIDTTGYKKSEKEGGRCIRVKVLKQLRKASACLKELTDETISMLSQSDHLVDAFVSSIVALMAELDRRPGPKCEKEPLTHPIPAGMEALAKIEGWIVLPTQKSLGQLAERLANSPTAASLGCTGSEVMPE